MKYPFYKGFKKEVKEEDGKFIVEVDYTTADKYKGSIDIGIGYLNIEKQIFKDRESAQKVADCINELERKEANQERRMRYNHVGSLEGHEEEFKTTEKDDPYSLVLEKMNNDSVSKEVGKLSATQQRRWKLYQSGHTLKEISQIENVSISSVHESIEAVRKILRKGLHHLNDD